MEFHINFHSAKSKTFKQMIILENSYANCFMGAQYKTKGKDTVIQQYLEIFIRSLLAFIKMNQQFLPVSSALCNCN